MADVPMPGSPAASTEELQTAFPDILRAEEEKRQQELERAQDTDGGDAVPPPQSQPRPASSHEQPHAYLLRLEGDMWRHILGFITDLSLVGKWKGEMSPRMQRKWYPQDKVR